MARLSYEYRAENPKEGLSIVTLREIFSQPFPAGKVKVKVEQGLRNQIKKLTIEVEDGRE